MCGFAFNWFEFSLICCKACFRFFCSCTAAGSSLAFFVFLTDLFRMVSMDICFLRASVRGSECCSGLLNCFCCLLVVTIFEVSVLQEGAFDSATFVCCSGVVIVRGTEGALAPYFRCTFVTLRVRIDWDCGCLPLNGFGDISFCSELIGGLRALNPPAELGIKNFFAPKSCCDCFCELVLKLTDE